MAGQQPLELPIGVRVPGGQPNLCRRIDPIELVFRLGKLNSTPLAFSSAYVLRQSAGLPPGCLYPLDGMSSFPSQGDDSPRLRALLLGGLLLLATLDAFSQQNRASAATRAAGDDVKLDAAKRHRVIAAVIANLKQHYVDPNASQEMAGALLAQEKSGDYTAVTDGAAFADLLTRQIRAVNRDMHLEVVYSRTSLPDRSTGSTPERLARYRKALEENNCTFEKVEILPHNIGYLKLNSFPELSMCRSTATASMASLNHADAMILDLRDNTGGLPDMVMLMAAYFFDHPEYMYNPRENVTERSWTRSPVPGNLLADKPVYVLTSARTFSGAEHFSYNLKMLKRATLVGETTGGATDVGIFHRIDDHFGMGIRETGAINPYSEPDWAGTGVEPDVRVKAADALETAAKLAERKLQSK
jgi:hypothetical protein